MLHCLVSLPDCRACVKTNATPKNYVRQNVWPNYYSQEGRFQNHSEKAGEPLFDHTDHCINAIRESLMCNADTTVNIWRWGIVENASVPRFDSIHTCRKWADIHSLGEKWKASWKFDHTVRVLDDLVFPNDEPF